MRDGKLTEGVRTAGWWSSTSIVEKGTSGYVIKSYRNFQLCFAVSRRNHFCILNFHIWRVLRICLDRLAFISLELLSNSGTEVYLLQDKLSKFETVISLLQDNIGMFCFDSLHTIPLNFVLKKVWCFVYTPQTFTVF